jgi:F0F1-type ATP synthase membrane subunit b/b'
LKRQASDAGEKFKSAAKDTKKKVEAESESVVDKVFQMINSVKDSLLGKPIHMKCLDGSIWRNFLSLGTLGMASKHTADLTDQAKEKFDEVTGKAKKTVQDTKKAAKDQLDL